MARVFPEQLVQSTRQPVIICWGEGAEHFIGFGIVCTFHLQIFTRLPNTLSCSKEELPLGWAVYDHRSLVWIARLDSNQEYKDVIARTAALNRTRTANRHDFFIICESTHTVRYRQTPFSSLSNLGHTFKASTLKRSVSKSTHRINDKFNTSVPNIIWIGNVTFGPMLAHKAEEEGIAAGEYIHSGHGRVNYI